MRSLLIVLLPILLIGCSEPERNAGSAEPERNASGAEPEWKARELERKAKVQSLIKQLSDESLDNRKAAFTELRDTYIRKRDIAELNKEIDRHTNPEVESFLFDLQVLVEFGDHWRLPDKVWTTDVSECERRWRKEIEALGCEASLIGVQDEGLYLTIPIKSEYRSKRSTEHLLHFCHSYQSSGIYATRLSMV